MLRNIGLLKSLAELGCTQEHLKKIFKNVPEPEFLCYQSKIKKLGICDIPQARSVLIIYKRHGLEGLIRYVAGKYDINIVLAILDIHGMLPVIDTKITLNDYVLDLYKAGVSLREIAVLISNRTGGIVPDYSHLRKRIAQCLKLRKQYRKIVRESYDMQILLCARYATRYNFKPEPEDFLILKDKFAVIDNPNIIADILINPEEYRVKRCIQCKSLFIGKFAHHCRNCGKKITSMDNGHF